jgi:hypothetical protein
MLAALCLAMVFAIALSSYMALCFTSLAMSTRNVVNSHCSELAEAGIEQALYSLNNGDWSGWTVSVVGSQTTFSTQMTMTASSGLVPTTGAPTPLNFGNGATGLVNITITENSGVLATIQSQGQMTLPNGSATNSSAVTTISSTLTASGTTGTATAPVFVNAVAATSSRVTFAGGGTVDSFNSNPSLGVFQAYSAVDAGASAVILSQDVTAFGSTVRLGDAVINGYAVGYDFFSPSTTNWLSYGGSGKLKGPTTPVATYIDSSRILSSPVPNQPISPEILPFTTQNIPAAGDPGGINVLNATCTLGSATAPYPVYSAYGIALNTGNVVTITGRAVIVVTVGSTSILNGGLIQLTPGASLAIFQENGSININCSGTGGITNSSAVPLAKNLALLSTTNNNASNTIKITQQLPFCGVVYFPYLRVTIGSTGVTAPITGSIVGESVTLSAAPVIHYDVALRSPDSIPGDVAFTSLSSPVAVNNLIASVP